MDDFPSVPTKDYETIRANINSGDLLLCSGSSIVSEMIKKVTDSVWSHVAFVIRLDAIERIMLLESVESVGVRTVPLTSYVHDYNATGKGYLGRIMLARHQDMQQANIANLSKYAVDLLGYPYDKDEIIRIMARIAMHAFNLESTIPKQDREFICSAMCFVSNTLS